MGLSVPFGPSGGDARSRCVRLVRHRPGQPPHCSDKDTSAAALRVCPENKTRPAGENKTPGGENGARPAGGHLLVSSRVAGQNGALSAIGLDETGRLVPPSNVAPLGIACTLGRTPRDFVLVWREGKGGGDRPRFESYFGFKPWPFASSFPFLGQGYFGQPVALVANQDSGTIAAIPVTGGGVSAVIARVPTPVCLCLAPEDSISAEPPYGEAAAGGEGGRIGEGGSAAAAVGVAVAALLLLAGARAWVKK